MGEVTRGARRAHLRDVAVHRITRQPRQDSNAQRRTHNGPRTLAEIDLSACGVAVLPCWMGEVTHLKSGRARRELTLSLVVGGAGAQGRVGVPCLSDSATAASTETLPT